jgi:hypothetical protein
MRNIFYYHKTIMKIIKRMEKLLRYARRRLFAFHFAVIDFSCFIVGRMACAVELVCGNMSL